MRILKTATLIMGVLIIVLFTIVVSEIFRRAGERAEAVETVDGVSPDLYHTDMYDEQAVLSLPSVRYPQGSHIAHILPMADSRHVVVHIIGPDAAEDLLMIDLLTGQTLSQIEVIEGAWHFMAPHPGMEPGFVPPYYDGDFMPGFPGGYQDFPMESPFMLEQDDSFHHGYDEGYDASPDFDYEHGLIERPMAYPEEGAGEDSVSSP